MSVEHLKQFGQKVVEDEELQKKAKEIGINNLEGQIAFAKELGFEFTMDDIQALAEEAGISGDELSDEQLEQVAGGALSTTAGLVLLAVGLVGGGAALAAGGLGAAAGAAAGGW